MKTSDFHIEERCPMCDRRVEFTGNSPQLPNMVEGFWIGYEWTCECGVTGASLHRAEFSHHGLLTKDGQDLTDKWGERVETNETQNS